MSELETKEQSKELTFEEICPNMAMKVANYDNLNEDKKSEIYHILSTNKCFVGEAHGYKNAFGTGCDECTKFATFSAGLCQPFSRSCANEPFNWGLFNERKDAFVKHWNEKHGKK